MLAYLLSSSDSMSRPAREEALLDLVKVSGSIVHVGSSSYPNSTANASQGLIQNPEVYLSADILNRAIHTKFYKALITFLLALPQLNPPTNQHTYSLSCAFVYIWASLTLLTADFCHLFQTSPSSRGLICHLR